MHILHLIKTSEGATWAIRLLQSIKYRYPEISFSVIIPPGGKHYKEYKDICRNVYPFEYRMDKDIRLSGNFFREIIIKDQPDVIHGWFTQTTLFMRLFLRNVKIPRVFQVVGPAHLENLIFRFGDIRSSQYSDYWIASSKYILKKYKDNKIPSNRLFLNYPYIDAVAMLEDKKRITQRDLRKEFNLNPGTKIIGTASFIYPPKFYEKTGIKGHEYLLKAFKKIIEKRSDVVLIISGSSFGGCRKYEDDLKQLAKEISPTQIIFTGKYNHILEVITNFDLFVYLSKSENLGGVFESLLYEIPTISSNKGALPELVRNNETGICLDPKDSDLLVEKINLLLNKDFDFTLKGRDLVLETFDTESIIKNAYNTYGKIIEDYKIYSEEEKVKLLVNPIAG